MSYYRSLGLEKAMRKVSDIEKTIEQIENEAI
jgi:hypothetical protein